MKFLFVIDPIKNINFTEYKIDGDEDARALMTESADGRRTLPQIFIDNEGIGGCDDLYTLENENKLDALLNSVSYTHLTLPTMWYV